MKALLRSLFRIPDGCGVKFGMLWRLGRLVGVNGSVWWPVHFTTTVRCPKRMKLGLRTFPGDSPNCYINAQNGIVVGDDVNIGPGVGLVSANHDFADNSKHTKCPPIRLGARTWIGMNAVILPGVELGENTIVGAGAIVTKSFPQGHVVLAGNPAKSIRDLRAAR